MLQQDVMLWDDPSLRYTLLVCEQLPKKQPFCPSVQSEPVGFALKHKHLGSDALEIP